MSNSFKFSKVKYFNFSNCFQNEIRILVWYSMKSQPNYERVEIKPDIITRCDLIKFETWT